MAIARAWLIAALALAGCQRDPSTAFLEDVFDGCKIQHDRIDCKDPSKNARILDLGLEFPQASCGVPLKVIVHGQLADSDVRGIVKAAVESYPGYRAMSVGTNAGAAYIVLYNGCLEASYGYGISAFRTSDGWQLERRERW